MIIQVKVIPNAKHESITLTAQNIYRVHVGTPAMKGKANERLIELLATHFKIPKKAIIIKNPASRNKIVDVKNL